ncbi:NAD(P)/FAD-dependent oxidoreductase [Croceitalea vernalis]|uniref:NAD(P)/FAD-dependent oxidoreductase n=1 Tax=Croceitalea vernalis TaxID=3075599 RepID=A0ABU3BC98_9FLAO|nr:NAD(P)/FAD-dependent oxidoreductase [Croceitalea sp. P007]MDT0620089.1 NAD(P)/FAD-dependent oxidoreductase [Croceitalea sp. P007]
MYDVIIAGGGAAGFYAAIQIAENNPKQKIAIFERGKTVLGKVKISGGGRCNVTHAEFNPQELINNYPRGKKELLGPFHTHSTGDIMQFFEERGVPLKIEEDGRIFPVSNSSQSIIDCFLNATEKYSIEVLRNNPIKLIEQSSEINEGWQVATKNKFYHCQKLLIATGSSPKMWDLLQKMGHSIIPPVPSLFTFNIKDERIKGIQGLSTKAEVRVLPKKKYDAKISIQLKSAVRQESLLESEGPLLITHWGLSGPAILKLSAWGAAVLNELNYNFRIEVNWLPEYSTMSLERLFMEIKEVEAKKTILKTKAVDIPRRLWNSLVKASGITPELRWADVSKESIRSLSRQLTRCTLKVEGKSTFKEEFVTAGGVDLKEINFKTFESKKLKNIYFAGEVINIDAITGGFNFQNAWTGAYIAAQAIVNTQQ